MVVPSWCPCCCYHPGATWQWHRLQVLSAPFRCKSTGSSRVYKVLLIRWSQGGSGGSDFSAPSLLPLPWCHMAVMAPLWRCWHPGGARQRGMIAFLLCHHCPGGTWRRAAVVPSWHHCHCRCGAAVVALLPLPYHYHHP